MAFMLLGLPFAASAQSQKVTIDVKGVDVQLVFKQIKEQTKLNFVYNADQLREMKSVTLNVKDVTVDSALSKLFAGTPFEYKFEMQSIVIKRKAEKTETEKVMLSGKVTDKDGEPLPGVAVLLKGTLVGTATDMNGNFKFLVPGKDNTVLIFSFIGMKRTEVQVKGTEPVTVILEEDATELDEVQVVSLGYFQQDKRTVTGDITTLKMDDIMVAGAGTLDQMLESRVPGMIFMQNSGQVGAAPKLKIRGSSTIIGNQEPLWVVDGFILSDPVKVDPEQINDPDFVNLLGNAISGLNPDDIEQIDVLKDAAATAIYGAQAANGVIVITTKKGKPGPPSVSYSMTGTFTQRPRYSDRAVRVMNSKDRIALSRELYEKGMPFLNLKSWVGYEGAMKEYLDGKLDFNGLQDKVSYLERVNTDWFDILLKDAFSHNHTLNLSGGNEGIRYYTSVGYRDDQGNIRKESNKRYTASMNLNVNYNKFSGMFKLSGNVQKREYTPSDVNLMSYAYNSSRAIPAYTEDCEYYFYHREDGTTLREYNILNERDHSYNKVNTNGIDLGINLKYKVMNPLEASVAFSYQVSNNENATYYGEETFYAACLRRDNVLTGEVDKASSLMPFGGELKTATTRNEKYTVRGQLSYNDFFGQDQEHNVAVSVIGEISSGRYTGLNITQRGYMPDRGEIFSPVDLTYINTSSAAMKKVEYEAYAKWRLSDPAALGVRTNTLTNNASMIGTVTYSYRSHFTLNANARINASNRFGDESNKKLNPIWSFSGRWNMHENILRNVTAINMLNLRMSCGLQGNMPNTDSPDLIIKKGAYNTRFEEYMSTIYNFPNPYLKWEKTVNFSSTLEFALLRNKIRGSVTYYYRKTRDAFLSKTVSAVNGVENYTVNKGTLTNQGYELSFNFTPIDNAKLGSGKKGFTWRLDPQLGSVFNQLIDKVKGKDKVLLDEISYGDYLNGSVPVSGRPLNTFYSYKFAGLSAEDGRPLFHGTEEENKERYARMSLEDVCMEVMTHSGCREPFLQGGISNSFSYGDFVLSFNIGYSVGSKIRLFQMYPEVSGVSGTLAPAPDKNVREEMNRRWRRPGDELNTTIPGILWGSEFDKTLQKYWWKGQPYTFGSNIWNMYDQSDLRVVSGDYVKLQSMSFRYIVPTTFCKKLSLKSAYVSLSGSNLFTICSKKLKGQSPTQSGTSSTMNISVRPTYSITLNVTL